MPITAAIVGLPKSGKTMLFSALSGIPYSRVLAVEGASGFAKASVTVPDLRADALAEIFKPAKVVRVSVEFVDFAAQERGSGSLLSGPVLNAVAQTDILLVVVRGFEDPGVPHPMGRIDPEADLETVGQELAFLDLEVVDRRLRRIGDQIGKVRSADREALLKERELLERLKTALEASVPVNALDLTEDEVRRLRGYQFLTAKPRIGVLNLSEKQLGSTTNQFPSVGFPVIAVAAMLEAEAAELAEDEAQELLAAMGVEVRAREVIPSLCLTQLGLVRFYTCSSEEVHVWTLPRGATVLEAAGQIHSDMQRGFIRAEVVSFEDMVHFRSLAEARRHGALKLEGRNYQVQDGDVVHILFSV